MFGGLKNWRCLALVVLLAVSGGTALGQGTEAEKTADGVVVAVGEGFVKLSVRSENVIHVQYARDKAFFSHTSISALRFMGEQTTWSLATDGGASVISTDKLQARIDPKTSAVSFLDRAGKVILAEKADGRTMEPAEVQGEKTFHVRQRWEAPEDESLYGLLENQLGLIDIKNWDLDLWQHNGTAVTGFLVSSKGYGILWDNPSYTRFGDLSEAETIPADCLVDNDGKAGGLSMGTFTPGGEMQNVSQSAAIAVTAGARGRGRSAAGSGTRWEGKLAPKATGDYQFSAYSNGTIRAWIDGKQVMDHFRQSWLPWYDVARVHMEAGKEYPIRIEWAADGEGNQLQFQWKPPVVDREAQGTSLWSEVGDGIDYWFCYGPGIDQVISGYRAITGKAAMLPNWAYGYWQSRDHYSNQQQSIDAVKKFREMQIPLDNIVQDWQYWPGASLNTVGSWAFDSTRFPDPVGWTNAIHQEHAHLMISVWGWISSQSRGSDNYQQMASRNFLLGTRQVPGGSRTFVDFFNPEAGRLYWDQLHHELFDKGIDAWWLDASEPDIAGIPTLDAVRTLMNPNGMGTGARVLNGYPLLESKVVYEGQRAAAPDRRVFILTRSGYPGMQRYAAVVWSGDSTTTWQAMRKQITAGLSFSISGMPYWSMDIGGYALPARFSGVNSTSGRPRNQADADEWDELNARWFQFGTFVPMMRVHGQGAREIYNFGPQAQEVMIKFDRLRYALMPYVYSLAGDTTLNDGTIMRPLVMDFAGDAKAREIADQYLFGPALLVSPVTAYKARSRPVYLPAGADWYDFWTGAMSAGGQTIDAAAPYNQMPLFVRAGSILPLGPVMQYTGEKPMDPVTLCVYEGADGSFTLYEDSGSGYGYERGEISKIPLTWSQGKRTLTIGKRGGHFPGMLEKRMFNVIFVSREKGRGVDSEAKADRVVSYTGDALEVQP